MKKSHLLIWILIIFLSFLLGAGAMYAWQNWPEINPLKPKEVGCTFEAKICPDGSAVGRSGPNCKFAPCPTAVPGKPRIVETFACGDYCLGAPEKYLVKVYEGISDPADCQKIGGIPYKFYGWEESNICLINQQQLEKLRK